MGLAKPFGDDHVQATADCIAIRVAENSLRPHVPEPDHTLAVRENQCVGGLLEQSLKRCCLVYTLIIPCHVDLLTHQAAHFLKANRSLLPLYHAMMLCEECFTTE